VINYKIIIIIIVALTSSCGKKDSLKMVNEDKRPKFDNVIFEK